jgi:cell division protease FtsH
MGPMSHEEREQTLNQLLTELDGFDPQVGVVLMAATNRPEILDPALLRPGRFDRHVMVDRPDREGRLAILGVHARKIKLAEGVELGDIAGMTVGMAGADLANIINEAALLATRRGADAVEEKDLENAVERVIAGLEKRSRVLSESEKQRVAFHELGHALVALLTPGTDPVKKISIIPRGIAALGYTIQLPHEDRFLLTQSELEGRIAVLMGGRAAEEVMYGDVSTGAEDDLRKATDIAASMVRRYGMSDRIGTMSIDRPQPDLLGLGRVPRGEVSEEMTHQIDTEVQRILGEQRAHARRILEPRKDLIRAAAAELIARETLEGGDLEALIHADVAAHAAVGTGVATHH